MDTIKAAWAKGQEAWAYLWAFVDAYPRTAFVLAVAVPAGVRWFL